MSDDNIDDISPNVRCTDCDVYVELIRRENGTLALVCDCPAGVAIGDGDAIPSRWSDE